MNSTVHKVVIKHNRNGCMAWQALVNMVNEPSGSIKGREFLE
jgi:hypothetical protein